MRTAALAPAQARRRTLACAAAALAALAGSGSSGAQEFSRILRCSGSFTSGEKTAPAHADFALRFNNRTALIQRSNVLPVGERLAYVPSPAAYSMTYRLPAQGRQALVVPGWFQTTILVAYPDLRRLNQIRMSVDRRSGELEGEMLNEDEQPLGRVAMQCSSVAADDPAEAPKF